MLRSGVVAQNIRFPWRAGPRFAGVGGFSAELVADLMLASCYNMLSLSMTALTEDLDVTKDISY